MKLCRQLSWFVIALSCCAVFSINSSWAQPAAPAAKTVVIRAGHLLDVKTGKTLSHQTIVIQGDKIASVGGDMSVPAGAQVIDLSNATVLPGLIDAHTHVTMHYQLRLLRRLAISVPREALIGARNARVTLEAGFTTIRNVGASGYTDVALRDAINAGDVPGPRMLVSGPALSITGGHCDNDLLPFEYHAQRRRRRRWRRGRPAQDARDHQVRRRPDQSLRHRRSAFAWRQSAGLAIHAGRDEGHCGRRAPARPQGRGARARRSGHSLGVGGGRGFGRARVLHRRRGDRHDEEERYLSRADALPGRLVPGKCGEDRRASRADCQGARSDAGQRARMWRARLPRE